MTTNNRRNLLLAGTSALVLSACATSMDATTRKGVIDSAANNALARLYQEQPESKQLASKARGVLIFPEVKSAGFIVGGAYGEGVLRVAGRSVDYYETKEGSFGLVAGAETRALIMMFMTDEALKKFQNSKGWTAGADASVTMADKNYGGGTDTMAGQQQVIAYVLSLKGIMANVSVDGAKISKLNF
jgi:lipid-binding SYLF domain-containing protein